MVQLEDHQCLIYLLLQDLCVITQGSTNRSLIFMNKLDSVSRSFWWLTLVWCLVNYWCLLSWLIHITLQCLWSELFTLLLIQSHRQKIDGDREKRWTKNIWKQKRFWDWDRQDGETRRNWKRSTDVHVNRRQKEKDEHKN